MSFLDDVLKPGEGVKIALRHELEHRRDNWRAMPGHIYRGAGDHLLQHGQFFAGRKLPDSYAHLVGAESGCYLNALQAAEQDPSLRYCEGIYSISGGMFMGHAWCIDANNEVVEVTVPTENPERYHPRDMPGLTFLPLDRWGYWGCAFDTAWVRAQFDVTIAEHDSVGLYDITRTEATQFQIPQSVVLTTPEDYVRAAYPVLMTPYPPA